MGRRVGRKEGWKREEGAVRSMAGEEHGSGAAQQSAAARSMAGEEHSSGAAQQSAAARSMAGEEHGSGAAQQSAAATPSAGESPCRAAAAISRTWPWMSEASSKYLAAEVEAGRCREIEEQVRISEQGRGANQNSPLSNALVTCTSASVFLKAFVENFLQLLIKVQVSSTHSAYACSGRLPQAGRIALNSPSLASL